MAAALRMRVGLGIIYIHQPWRPPGTAIKDLFRISFSFWEGSGLLQALLRPNPRLSRNNAIGTTDGPGSFRLSGGAATEARMEDRGWLEKHEDGGLRMEDGELAEWIV
jgi:hypothetical protein